jgi:hypothetical protein
MWLPNFWIFSFTKRNKCSTQTPTFDPFFSLSATTNLWVLFSHPWVIHAIWIIIYWKMNVLGCFYIILIALCSWHFSWLGFQVLGLLALNFKVSKLYDFFNLQFFGISNGTSKGVYHEYVIQLPNNTSTPHWKCIHCQKIHTMRGTKIKMHLWHY